MAKPFDCKINNDEKQEVLDWRNTVIMQVDCLTHLVTLALLIIISIVA